MAVNNETGVTSALSSESNIKQSLGRIRKKLLDLSRRNRLLNYRAGSRSLAIEDGRLDEVFEILVADEKTMYFEPRPEPVGEVAGESDEATIQSGLFPSTNTIEHENTGNGINSVELTENESLSSRSAEPKLKSDHLQTQLYAMDLDRRLKKISGDAQTAIEESGTNILYIAVGFLEWYEDENSSEKNRAPLILIPVSLERGKFNAKEFRYRYTLQYSGEDIVSNLSLAEKLRRDFNIALPEIGDDLSPEEYLSQVETAVTTKRHWHVARDMTLGMFSFGKLLMYLDLDPDKWPNTSLITKHSIIRTLLDGASEADGNPYGEIYQIDVDPKAAAIPLVVDADSSQHSAIIDAMSGRNLVIEGPPGTGKSQTITNLIAMSLAQGKSVLFVSEKMAALEVVRRNLDKVGLGDFCLELHSHKTQKQKLLKDIEARLSRKYKNAERYPETLAELNNAKKALQNYVDAVNEPYGKTEMTVHDIMWSAERARNLFQVPPRIQMSDPKDVSRLDIKQRQEILSELHAHWTGMEPEAISAWKDISLHKYYATEQQDLGDVLGRLMKSFQELISAANYLPPVLGGESHFTFNSAAKLVSAQEVLQSVPASLEQALVSALLIPGTSDQLKEIEDARAFLATSGQDQRNLHDAGNRDITSVNKALDVLSQSVSGSLPKRTIGAELTELIAEVKDSIIALDDTFKRFAGLSKMSYLPSLIRIHESCQATRLATLAPIDLLVHAKRSMSGQESLEALSKAEMQASKISIHALALEEIFNLPALPGRDSLVRMQQSLQAHGDRFFRFLSSDYRQAKAALRGILRDPKSASFEYQTVVLSELIAHVDAKHAFAQSREYQDLFGVLYTGVDTDWNRLRRLLTWTTELGRNISNGHLLDLLLSGNERNVLALANEYSSIKTSVERFSAATANLLAKYRGTKDWIDLVQSCGLPIHIEQWLFSANTAERAAELAKYADKIKAVVSSAADNVRRLQDYGDFSRVVAVDDGMSDVPLKGVTMKLAGFAGNTSTAGKWADYCRASQTARSMGLGPILDLFETGTITAPELTAAYEYATFNSLSRAIVQEQPLLRNFTRINHEQTRRRFADLDRKILELNRNKIAYHASVRVPDQGISRGPVKRLTEMGLIYHEVGKKKRHVPIRELVERAGNALRTIKPCFMMGPLSVAQYIRPGRLEFDLVIMDEASQVRPEEGLGAIARGKQIVIVGDPKQLPPTSFFDKLGDVPVNDEEELALDDSESILDISMQTYRPARRLSWHYRSEHESLINYSNHEFYDKDLILFPSPTGIRHGLGVRFHYIKNALYEARRNKAEAEVVARAVVSHVRRYKDLSLGVGTFNLQQKELIEDRIERFRTVNPVLEEYILKQSANNTPFFIKNLENIQGDERDVIFISTTYGPDSKSKRVMQRFGPINSPNGWRRLNVIVTRAKKRVEVFSSMMSSDILVTSTSSRGVRALKGYLEYAERGGKITEVAQQTGKDPDSPFEEAVAHVLRQAGYTAVPQIGVAGYFIDIGVQHPSREGEFILGVECDGATYHSAMSARDRDRLRQDVLESRGWKIHRIWSTDWFNNRESEIHRLLQRIEKCVAESGGAVQADIPEQAEDIPVFMVAHTAETTVQPTVVADSAQPSGRHGLTLTEAKFKLLELQNAQILPKHPDNKNGILRKEMLEALLRNLPTTVDEFREYIPLKYREGTAPEQMQYLDEILKILESVEN